MLSRKIPLSIVTVVRDDRARLERTLSKVIGYPWFQDVEYVVQDGASHDGTFEVATERLAGCSNARVVCEQDVGIWDAMNKAVSSTSRDWILFLNAGDLLAEDFDPRKLLNDDRLGSSDVIYGDWDVVDPRIGTRVSRTPGPITDLAYRMPLCHQAAIVRRSLLCERPFSIDESAADFEFFHRLHRDGARFAYAAHRFAIYEAGGLSDVQRMRFTRSRIRVVCRAGDAPANIIAPLTSDLLNAAAHDLTHLIAPSLLDWYRRRKAKG